MPIAKYVKKSIEVNQLTSTKGKPVLRESFSHIITEFDRNTAAEAAAVQKHVQLEGMNASPASVPKRQK
ncbi:hypothetical protein EVAR_73077_1 [Eumeta japonica]|uniref:Uncharacterized protein n=1 Tax=Eumeta variegata TaxID=151549 RepID=A0A4C1TK65_EUMVA|nr:hypothetical protein EVAR_73077_1 [Eumeta japonica]